MVYGIKAGTIKKSSDVPLLMGKALDGMTGYIVLAFVIAQFINMFNFTNLGMIIAVKSAGALQAAGFTGIPLMIFFILLCCLVNLFMTRGTAKWYIFAPILVPMMMMLGVVMVIAFIYQYPFVSTRTYQTFSVKVPYTVQYVPMMIAGAYIAVKTVEQVVERILVLTGRLPATGEEGAA